MSWEVVSCWIESHPGLASWVQAVGSIAAIMAAWAIPYFHEQSKEKRARKHLIENLLHVARMQLALQKRVHSALDGTGDFYRWTGGTGSTELAINTKLLSELPASAFTGMDMSYLSGLRFAASSAVSLGNSLLEKSPMTWRTQNNEAVRRVESQNNIVLVEDICERLKEEIRQLA